MIGPVSRIHGKKLAQIWWVCLMATEGQLCRSGPSESYNSLGEILAQGHSYRRHWHGQARDSNTELPA
jgi:hypothetical protein